MPTYEIVKLDHRSIAGDDLWTVVQYRYGVCTGGDHHWVRERYAERAKAVYEAGYDAWHGHATPDRLGEVYRSVFRAEMFDKDRP